MIQDRRETHLIETEELAERIERGDAKLRVVDMRGYVRTETDANGVQTASYEGARNEYDQSHIPGAVYLDWTRDIVDINDSVAAQVANSEQIKAALERAGIGDEHEIVAYDSHPASQFATRLWWVLRFYGHENVRVLNGGWSKWTREGRTTTAEISAYSPATFTPRIQTEWRATAEEVRDLIGDPGVCLLDARDAGQYTGAIRRGPRGGHIPGAINVPREALFQADGTFQPLDAMQVTMLASGAKPESRIVAYCNGGVAATSVLFALSMLGYPHLTNYDGSWNEWTERPDLPTES